MVRNSGFYRSLSDFLVDNPLVKEGYQFDLNIANSPVPRGKYYLSAGEGKLVAVGSGIRYDISSLFNGRYKVDVDVSPELQTASQARLQKSLSQASLTSLTDGIQTNVTQRPLTPIEIAEFQKAQIDTKYKYGKELNSALLENARIVTRKVTSLDVESMVNKDSKKILYQDVFSVGMAESVDVTYAADNQKYPNLGRIRKSTFATNSAFDIHKTISMFQQDLGSIEKVSTYGRQNLALVMDHVNKYVTGDVELTPDMQRSRTSLLGQTFGAELKDVQANIKSNNGSLVRIMEIANADKRNLALNSFLKTGAEAYGNKGEKLIGFLQNVSKQLIDTRLIKDSQAVEHSSHAGTMLDFSLGKIEVAGGALRGAGSSQLTFRTDVMSQSVNDMFKAVSNNGTKQFLTFGDAEFNVYKGYGHALEKELALLNNVGTLSKNDEVRKQTITETIQKLGVVKNAFVDVKERSEQMFDALIPGIRQQLKDNATGVRSVFERLFGSENTQRINHWGVERFLDQKHSGFSLENLYKVFKDSEYTEWHTGGMDSADLGHFNMWMEDMLKNQREYRAPTAHNMPGPGMAVLESNNLEMFNVSSKLARNIQSKTVISELLRDRSNDDIMSLIGKAHSAGNEHTKAIIDGQMSNLLRNKSSNEIRFRKDVVDVLQNTVNAELKDHSIKLNAQPTSAKYRAPESSLLAKVVSAGNAGRFFAIAAAVYFGSKTAAEDPETSIETGEHNSTETTARRLVTTPFGSKISKLAALLAPFPRRIVANAEMGSMSAATRNDDIVSFLASKFDDASQVLTDKTAMSPAVDSLARRLQRTDVLNAAQGTFIPELRRDATAVINRASNSSTEHFANLVSLRENRLTPRIVNPDNLALHMEGMNAHKLAYRDKFYLGSTPPAQSQMFELSPNTKTYNTFLYGDPLSFAKNNTAIRAAEDIIIQPNPVGMAKPAFSGNFDRVKVPMLTDTGKLDTGFIQDLSKEAVFSRIKEPAINNLSSAVAGRRQSKPMGTTVTIADGNMNHYVDSVMEYEGTLQNFSPVDKNSFAGANVLRSSRKLNYDRPVLTKASSKRLETNVFTSVNSGISLDASPVYHSRKPIMNASVPTARTQRAAGGYHDQVNMLLQKGTKVGYPGMSQ